MKKTKTEFEGLIIIEQDVFSDSRGSFSRVYNKKEFEEIGVNCDFLEDNLSISQKGVLRGLHFQKKPFELAKLVYVSFGKVLDVVVDLRKSSKTYGKYFSVELVPGKMLFVPEGFCHGFLCLEDETILNYKYSNVYNKEHEVGVSWNDKDLNIDWQLSKYGISEEELIVSEKDQKNLSFKEIDY
jgi:dTDP-4-dehydrorhamnose 3,5-epimerase